MNRRQIISAAALVFALISGPLQVFAQGPVAVLRGGVKVVEAVSGAGAGAKGIESAKTLEALIGARAPSKMPSMSLEALTPPSAYPGAISTAEDVWTSLVKRYCQDGQSATELRRKIVERTRQSPASEDIAQDVLLNIFQKCDQILSGSISEPGRYVQSTIKNRTTDLFRSPTVLPYFDQLNDDIKDPALSPEQLAIYRQVLYTAKLTPRQSQAFTLYLEGYTRAEIAERLEIGEESVKRLIADAKSRVRASL